MPAPSPLVSVERLTWTLPDGRVLLHDVSLAIAPGRTGLVGPNGSGKSTLAHLIAGELVAQTGRVVRSGRVALLRQTVALDGARTLADWLGVAERLGALRRIEGGSTDAADYHVLGDDWMVRERASRALARVGLGHLDPEAGVGAVSGGEATRAALAGLLLAEPDLLVLDEPTNNLDAPARAALQAFVEDFAGGVLVVSHDRALLDRMDRIVELRDGHAVSYGGNFSAYEAQRAVERDAAARELDSATAMQRRTERAARETIERQARRSARGRRTAIESNLPPIVRNAMKRTAEATTARIADVHRQRVEASRERVKSARERVEDRRSVALALAPTGLAAGKVVVAVEGVSFSHAIARPLLSDVTLHLVGPERVALTGPNGSGKTTLLRLVCGELAPTTGRVRVGVPPDRVAWLDQHLSLLDVRGTVLDAFRARHPDLEDEWCRLALARFLFRADDAHKPVAALSGGERLRAALATVLGVPHPPLLLVLDEPTNHLDLDTLGVLEAALRGYDGALLVVSHDGRFLDAIGIERRVALPGGVRGTDAPRGA